MNKYKNSKLMLILSVLLIFFLLVGSASAAENTDKVSNETVLTSTQTGVDTLETVDQNDDSVVSAADTDVGSDTDDEMLSSVDDENILTETRGTHAEFVKKIDETPENGVLNLDKDYELSSVVSINKSMTINGNGYTIHQLASNSYLYCYSKNLTEETIELSDPSNPTTYNVPVYISVNLTNINFNYQNTVTRTASVQYSAVCDSIISNCSFNRPLHLVDWCHHVVVDNCNFINSIGGGGGAIFTRGHGPSGFSTIEGYKYIPCHNLTISNCYFENCHSLTRGGAIEINAPDSLIINCIIDRCWDSADSGGGAIDLYSTAIGSKVINCTITNCQATKAHGGGILIESASAHDIEIINCTLINNSAAKQGGAIYFNGANSTIENCIFINNTAKVQGGAVNFNAPDSQIINSIFINNTSPNGGAVYFSATNCQIRNSNFTNNNATTNGGAIYYKATNCILDNSLFTNNTANDGGAVYYAGSNCTLGNSILINNTATGDGGAIYFDGDSCNLTYCIVDFNTAGGAGGAVKFTGSGCNITLCNFTNNTAGTHGGAVHFNGTNSEMWYCFYTNNTCLEDGGALCSQASGSTVAYCNFTNRNNTAKYGNDFYAHPGCTITFIGLKFTTLWLTNETYYDATSDTYDTDVAHGYGTGYERPACWDDDDIWLNFLETSGNPTIYVLV